MFFPANPQLVGGGHLPSIDARSHNSESFSLVAFQSNAAWFSIIGLACSRLLGGCTEEPRGYSTEVAIEVADHEYPIGDVVFTRQAYTINSSRSCDDIRGEAICPVTGMTKVMSHEEPVVSTQARWAAWQRRCRISHGR